MKTKLNFGRALAIVAVMAITALFTNSVYAADEKPEYRMDIYPALGDLGELKQGMSYSDKFTLENSGKQEFDYEITFTPYSVVSDQYEPDYDTVTQYTEMSNWISVDKLTGHLGSGDKTEINYTVNIPETHGGAQAATIMITMVPSDDLGDTGVQAIRRLGYVVYGNVDGEIIQTANIIENKIPGFLFQAPLYAESVIENTGNVLANAEYTLQVFPLFSDEEIYTNEEEPSKELIFPETTRYNKIAWEGSPKLGIYKVRQTVKLFDAVSTEEKLVFICPIWFLLICLAVLFVILFSIINHIRNRNK